MSWITEDGEHEAGWLAFSMTAARPSARDDGSVEFLELVTIEGDRDDEEQASSDRVCEWAVQCTCGRRGSRCER